MADNFKRFLDHNISQNSSEIQRRFTEMLQKATITSTGVQKITRQIFEAASTNLGESEKALLNSVESFINTLQSTCLQPVPRVRDTMFFPDPSCEGKLVRYLESAKSELLVCVFTITNNNLRDALARAHSNGVNVRIISDDECMKQNGSDVQYLRDVGIPTETDTNPDAHMHNKFVIIDKEILITGSFNWTMQAVNSNQENLVVLHDPEICAQYINYFDGLWKNFRPVEVERARAAMTIQKNYRGYKDRRHN
jgi:phosphatidylserine/phosphatidylglycerophosphate/cardiolipin synthase-like enzyme